MLFLKLIIVVILETKNTSHPTMQIGWLLFPVGVRQKVAGINHAILFFLPVGTPGSWEKIMLHYFLLKKIKLILSEPWGGGGRKRTKQ